MSEDVLTEGDFREILLVEAYRSESGDVGVDWGKDWGKRSLDHPSELFLRFSKALEEKKGRDPSVSAQLNRMVTCRSGHSR